MWPKNRGVSDGELYAVVSQAWLGMPGVRHSLRNAGVTEPRLETGPSEERCYLIRLSLNIPLNELGEGP